jgi:hypothetical protein
VRLAFVFAALSLLGCHGGPDALAEADRWMRTGRVVDAKARFLDLTWNKDPRIKVLALVGAARASERLKDRKSERELLERAVAIPDVPGTSEEAYFDYAEFLRADGDRARALNFYYLAAAGAEKNRQRGFPYQKAVDAIAVMATLR